VANERREPKHRLPGRLPLRFDDEAMMDKVVAYLETKHHLYMDDVMTPAVEEDLIQYIQSLTVERPKEQQRRTVDHA